MFGATVFLGAFLLFLVQPIVAKLILPLFGGGVGIWATCLVFFQVTLLVGYGYAHLLVERDRGGALRRLHVALLAASLLALPLAVQSVQLQPGDSGPAWQILVLLIATIGAPFALLATTSPLLQAWRAQRGGRDPYRLFVVSNLASLAALVAYPWAIEPWLGAAAQAQVWSLLYALYVVLAAWVAWHSGRTAHDEYASPAPRVAASAWHALGARRLLGWIALAALASYELVAVTNHLTQNIPSMPMMWVLPLGLYLLTFTLCFDGQRWYRPRAFRIAALLAVAAMCWMLGDERLAHQVVLQAGTFGVGLFVICMVCHGELARDRPPAQQLTAFYLCVASGGALGGAVVGLGAPALLPGYFEVEIGLVLVTLALLWRSSRRSRVWAAAGASVMLGAAATATYRIDDAINDVVAMSRNFYGVLRVREYGSRSDPGTLERRLVHGSIMHGQQYLDDALRRLPTTYYVPSSGIGRLLLALRGRPITLGVVGLGAGTLAVYGQRGDHYRFFEIDPAVVAVAHKYFSFLGDSPAAIDIEVGDGRMLLQRDGARTRFDVLAVDAFSGDSIPVHLLTREAVALYMSRIASDGVIALHVSNRYLDLRPVVGRIATELGLQVAYVEDAIADTDGPQKTSSDWILLARNRSVLDRDVIREGTRALPPYPPGRTWTDDYSNIVGALSLKKAFLN
ncbi:MAG TPA: fused MFS/spermidine synthase [Burkholderiaceae bacterium]|nr:fused MFS/spermidine synthase [Burkholderiaceae bacterium]